MHQGSDITKSELAALLQWQIEAGVDEVIADQAINRFDQLEPARPKERPLKKPLVEKAQPKAVQTAQLNDTSLPSQPIEYARKNALECQTLEALQKAIENYEHCALKRGANKTVFSDGNPKARLMLIGEAPGRDEDLQGKPFVGAAGQLLDRILAAIGYARHAENPEKSVYITNMINWRPPQNRDPSPEELEMMMPFIERHIALKAPDLIVTLGNIPTKALLQTQTGITRMRGQWASVFGVPVIPTFHPASLLRNPANKKYVWADFLAVKAKLKELS